MVKLKAEKGDIIRKAEELAVKYEAEYKGCCQCTFLAIVDALRWGGIDIIPENAEERLYPAISILTAGVCMTGEGTCGAVSGGVMAMGLALIIPRDSADITASKKSITIIRDTLLASYYRQYGSILCKDVQRKYFGKAWDLTNPEMDQEFRETTHGCTIIETAKQATEFVLGEFEKGIDKGFKA